MTSFLRATASSLFRVLRTPSPVPLLSSIRAAHAALRDDERRVLTVQWEDGRRTQHPYTWLKDSCRCTTCAHPVSRSRLSLMSNLDLKATPQNIGFDEKEDLVRIAWNDGHQSVFPVKWLADRDFTAEERKRKRAYFFGPPARPWGKDHVMSVVDWTKALNDKAVLLELVTSIKEDGVCFVRGAPTDESGLDRLIYAIGFPWACNYGVYFDVKNKGDPSNVSYTPTALNIHTDLPYYFVLPGVQFLHCMKKTEGITGGENQITDGLFVAQDIRENHPDAFKTLTETIVQFWDYGTDFVEDYHYVGEQTTIRLDGHGEVCGIAFSNHLRDTYLDLPPEKTGEFYRALKLFDNKLYEHCINTQLSEGDILIMDNHRVAHGRSAYTIATANDERHLRGTYIAWDEFNSRLRRLRAEFGK